MRRVCFFLMFARMQALQSTALSFDRHFTRRAGKVRDIYTIDEAFVLLVATDRLSAFDHILPQAIPNKGQVLNQLAVFFLEQTEHICPNHLLAIPHPYAMIGTKCEIYPIEVIVRGYLCGSAWRKYKAGLREICGVPLPDGLKENDQLPEPIVTPTTKAQVGHDEDISERDIIASGMVPGDEWGQIRHYAMALYKHGAAYAKSRGLILADTKYEFGNRNFQILLADELHTPDSSRYFYAEGFDERQAKGEPQKQLSKEFARQWLIQNDFQGLEGQSLPDLPNEVVMEIRSRYIEVF
ncbi:MAG: phosphoribosylaminoimidazolesuccinocarboxamide synthase [Bacteroidota bacterium]